MNETYDKLICPQCGTEVFPPADTQDAKRYRWLRNADWTTDGVMEIYWTAEESEHLTGVELDAAIDAAMEGKK